MLVCMHCRFINRDEANFCEGCGKPVRPLSEIPSQWHPKTPMHTGGNWTIGSPHGNCFVEIVAEQKDGTTVHVANVRTHIPRTGGDKPSSIDYVEIPEGMANAHLFAAAKDMYKLLDAIEFDYGLDLNRCPVCGNSRVPGHKVWCELGRVLRKSRGEAS